MSSSLLWIRYEAAHSRERFVKAVKHANGWAAEPCREPPSPRPRLLVSAARSRRAPCSDDWRCPPSYSSAWLCTTLRYRRGCCADTAVARCDALRSITAVQAVADLCRSPNINIARDPRWGMLRHCLTQCQHASDATMQHTAYNAARGGCHLRTYAVGARARTACMLRRCRQARGC